MEHIKKRLSPTARRQVAIALHNEISTHMNSIKLSLIAIDQMEGWWDLGYKDFDSYVLHTIDEVLV